MEENRTQNMENNPKKSSIKKPSGWNIFYQEVAPTIMERLSEDSNIGNVSSVAAKMWRQIGGERRKDWKGKAQQYREDLDTGMIEEEQNCPNCNRVFSREKDYRYHKKSCVPATCKDCGEHYQNPQTLKTHIALVHAKTFKCEICEKIFANKRNLQRHEVVHTMSKFKCEACNCEFSTKGSMQRHTKKQHSHLR